ncbi:hypothetical protein C0J52_12369 [Blattella germanica]|nr:hypothetical protein C0J52_12369 [Blattella germanica]
MPSLIQHQVQLLAALESRDMDTFSQLLQESPDASCLEAACREPDCTEYVKLLLDHGVDPNTVLLHDSRTDVNSLNGSEQTALHITVKNCKQDIETFRNCTSLLIAHHINVNSVDWLGNTALHYAVQNGDQEIAYQLLKHSAHLGARNHEGEMPVDGIEPAMLEKFLNSCITLENEDFLVINYEFLVPPKELNSFVLKDDLLSEEAAMMFSSQTPEMDPILAISTSSRLRHLISHPTLSIFANIKWQRAKKFYFFSLAFYVFFVIILTTVIMERIYSRQQNSFCHSLSLACLWKIIGYALLAICCVCELIKLIFTISITPIKFSKNVNNYIQFFLTIFAIVTLFSGSSKIVTAITLFFAWMRLFFLIGEHPTVAVHFYLFKFICYNFFRFVMWSLLLVCAFSFSFFALFNEVVVYVPEKTSSFKPFSNPFTSLFSTIGLSLGVFDRSLLPFEFSTVLSYAIFVLFCFLLLLVFTNALTSIAVVFGQKAFSRSELICLNSKITITSQIERLLLGNPLYVHLRLRRLNLSHSRLMVWIVKLTTRLWLTFNCIHYLKGLESSVVLYPIRSISVPLTKNVNVNMVNKFIVDERTLHKAAEVARVVPVFRSQEEQLSNMEAVLNRTELVQREILRILQLQNTG